VLEGVEVVARKEKNRYTWLGLQDLNKTLARLKTFAGAGSPRQPKDPRPRDSETPFRDGDSGVSSQDSVDGSSPFISPVPLEMAEGGPKQRTSRSLGILAQRFVMMFMTSEASIVRPVAAAAWHYGREVVLSSADSLVAHCGAGLYSTIGGRC